MHKEENPLLVTHETLFFYFCQKKSHTFSQVRIKVNTAMSLYPEPKAGEKSCES